MQRAREAERGSLADESELELAAGDAQRAQQAERPAPPQHRERLRREHQERAGPQGNERQHVEIDAVGPGYGRRAIALDLRRHGECSGRKAPLQRRAKGLHIDAGVQPRSMRFKRPRRSKIHCAEAMSMTPSGWPIGAFGQHADDAQRFAACCRP